MANPAPARTTPDRPVGRQFEQRWLDDAFAAADAGRSGVRIVAGDAGLGKSRLVADALARHRGEWLTAVGNCVEAGEHGLPYAPLTGWLRDVARDPDGAELIAQISEGAPGLLPLVDELDAGAVSPEEAAPLDTTTGLGQLRLFDALTRLLEELSRRRPTAVVIEDLHWADRSTLAFVSYVCRNRVPGALVMILTVRTDEPALTDHLPSLLGELASLPGIGRVDLAPLSGDEVADLVAAVWGAQLPRATAEEIARRSGGNPFLAEQLLNAEADRLLGVADAAPAAITPAGHLADVLHRRLAPLSPGARELVSVAALGGQCIDHDVLVAVAGRDEDDVIDAVRELVDRRLLVSDVDGRSYRFPHALIAEHAAAELLPVERRRLHARFAEVLELSAQPAVVTRHRLGAGDFAGAFASSHAAAIAARQLAARSDEVAHWQRVLDLWGHANEEAHAAVGGESTVARLAAVAAADAGDITTAVELAERAVATATVPADRALARNVLAPLLMPVRTARFDELEAAEAAVADSEAACEPDLVLESRFVLARAYYHAGRFAEAAAVADEVGAMAVRLDRPAIAVGADATADLARRIADLAQPGADGRPVGDAPGGDAERSSPKEQELVDAALACDDTETALWVITRLAEWWWPYDLHRAEQLGATAYEYAVHNGLRASVRGVWARETLTLCRLLNGSWDAVEELARDDPLGFNDLTAATLALETQVEINRGELDRGRRRLDLARRVSRDALGHGYVAIAAISLRLAEGDPAGAVAECVERLERLPPHTGYSDIEASLVARGVGALADAVETGLDPADGAELLAAADRVDRRAREHPDPRHTDSPVSLLRAHRSRLERSDPDLWRRAIELRRQRPFDNAVCRFHLAAALLQGGDASAAGTELQAAVDTFDQLGAVVMGERARALATRARLPLDAAGFDHGARPAGERWGLTDRELQVLERLSEGATNRAIGEQLFISAKTVSVHVSNILSKLGAANRSEAAAIARRYGLLS